MLGVSKRDIKVKGSLEHYLQFLKASLSHAMNYVSVHLKVVYNSVIIIRLKFILHSETKQGINWQFLCLFHFAHQKKGHKFINIPGNLQPCTMTLKLCFWCKVSIEVLPKFSLITLFVLCSKS